MSGNFDLELFIKERSGHEHFDAKQQHELIIKLLQKAFPAFIVIFKEALANSKGFPEIDFANFHRVSVMLKDDSILDKDQYQKLIKAFTKSHGHHKHHDHGEKSHEHKHGTDHGHHQHEHKHDHDEHHSEEKHHHDHQEAEEDNEEGGGCDIANKLWATGR